MKTKGFTLIEVMIIISIVGILIAIIIPAFDNSPPKSQVCYDNGYTSYRASSGRCERVVDGNSESVDREYLEQYGVTAPSAPYNQ